MSSPALVAMPAKNVVSPACRFGYNMEARAASDNTPTVFIVEQDIRMQQLLELMIRSQGWRPEICDSTREFLVRPHPNVPSALILCFSSRESRGLEVQKQIATECAEMPIIVTANYEDIPTTVQAMKAGALDFFMKPFGEEFLVTAIRRGLARSRAAIGRRNELNDLRGCYASLTSRERQVLTLIVTGLLNKQVGAELGISEITVKAHRGQVMQKMKADSFAQLVNLASRLRLTR
jgi:FixJ family two-component response regulator